MGLRKHQHACNVQQVDGIPEDRVAGQEDQQTKVELSAHKVHIWKLTASTNQHSKPHCGRWTEKKKVELDGTEKGGEGQRKRDWE